MLCGEFVNNLNSKKNSNAFSVFIYTKIEESWSKNSNTSYFKIKNLYYIYIYILVVGRYRR